MILLNAELNIYDNNKKHYSGEFYKGISIIIPTHKGENVILRCLNSLLNQTLSKELFEIIIIINGEKDITQKKISEFINNNNMDNIIIHYLETPSASLARNKGIVEARRKYITFIDDDDYVSKNFLEGLLNKASENTIVISQIADVNKDNIINYSNSINNQIKAAEFNEAHVLERFNMVLTINACKLIPTKFIKQISYDSSLKSGEDIVFFTELLIKNNFIFKISPVEENIFYYRSLRENSLSRRAMSFEFNVKERLDVIEKLECLITVGKDNAEKLRLIKQKIDAQALFINRFIKVNPDMRGLVIEEISKCNLIYSPFRHINKDLAKDLIISYCFPPYVDTGGNIVAKRIRERNQVVDVIYNNVGKIRNKDIRLNKIVEDLIDDRIEIQSYPSFSNWKSIREFCEIGLLKIKELENKKDNYRSVYSRVMFPASHFLAFEYKVSNPETKWIAEFSDPVLYDIYSKKREIIIEDNIFFEKVSNLLKSKKIEMPVDKNLFFWCEYLPYIFSDEIIFTNINQFKYMLQYLSANDVKELVVKKAKIMVQPTLPMNYYNMIKSEYPINQDKVNFAYFGLFYETRTLNEVFDSLEKIRSDFKSKYELHIFTDKPEDLRNQIKHRAIYSNVKINCYVSYLEFLNLTTLFDCLIAIDSMTAGTKSINPYLPSKLSDYMGSSKDNVWGIYEKNSIMSSYSLKYKSEIGDEETSIKIIEEIINRRYSL